MPQTPTERRAQRDTMARGRINPTTGKPFKNYNELDTWQRNQRARASGFTSRAAQRGAKERARAQAEGFSNAAERREINKANKMPEAFRLFLGDRQPNRALAREFNDSFGKQPKRLTQAERFRRRALRARIALRKSWDWDVWREEYDQNIA